MECRGEGKSCREGAAGAVGAGNDCGNSAGGIGCGCLEAGRVVVDCRGAGGVEFGVDDADDCGGSKGFIEAGGALRSISDGV